IVVHLLQVALAMLDVVFTRVLELLHLLAAFGARMTNSNSCFLRELVHDLYQLPATLFVERGKRHADRAALRLRVEPKIRIAESFLDCLHLALVPRCDGEKTRLGCGYACNLIQRHRLSIRFDSYGVEKTCRRLPGPDRGKLALRSLERFVHRCAGILNYLGYRAHVRSFLSARLIRRAQWLQVC